MIFKPDFDFNLLATKYGFLEWKEEMKEDFSEDAVGMLQCFDFVFQHEYSRRGQCYFLLANKEFRSLSIYASEPDGSGGSVSVPTILKQMVLDNIFE